MEDTEKKGGMTPACTNTGSEDIGVITADSYGETKRGLSPRHVQLMAIGGSIGTGLWVSIPPSLSLPLGKLPVSDRTPLTLAPRSVLAGY